MFLWIIFWLSNYILICVIRLRREEEQNKELYNHWLDQSELQFMALNPQLLPNGMPVPFVNEMFVLVRDGVEFEVDKIPGFVFPSLVTHVLDLLKWFIDLMIIVGLHFSTVLSRFRSTHLAYEPLSLLVNKISLRSEQTYELWALNTSLMFFLVVWSRGHGGHVKAKGVIYLSNIRMVFVSSKPVDNFVAFDMPLVQ